MSNEMQKMNSGVGKYRDSVDVKANFEEPRNTIKFSKICDVLRANAQLVAIVVSVFVGFLTGILIHDAVQDSMETKKIVMYIKFPGELFMRMLRMIIIPLTVASIVVALAEIDTGSGES